VELVDELKQPHQRIHYTIQTNGVLIDEEWAEFFKANDVLVGLSVDGPKELHDRYRVDKRGLGSFDRVMAGFEHLKQAEVDVNVLCTIHAGNQEYALDVYRFFRDDMGVKFIQFIPIVERTTETMLPIANIGWKTGDKPGKEKRPLYVLEGNCVTDRTVDPEAFGRFLTTIFDEWAKGDAGEVYIQHFDTALANWYGEPAGVCVFRRRAGRRWRWNTTATSTPAAISSSPTICSATSTRHRSVNWCARSASAVRPRQARHTARVLPELRGAFRVSRWLSKEPLHEHPRRRARPQLPVLGVQALLQPHRRTDEDHV
jgi:hypothetical protein